jgi:Type III restriction enzyme, res subunit
MTTTELPYRQTLRTLYDEAIAELNPTRNNSLTKDFSAKIGDAVFEAGYSALNDAVTDTHRMLTVSAPCGSGKTSFSYALAAAVTRLAERDPSAPYGVVFLVEQKEQAEKVYRELIELLPEQVRVWTEDHDVSETKSDKTKVHNPTARCSKSDLTYAPVAIVTQKFYLDKNGHQARTVIRNGVVSQRALTIVDEVPDEAPSQSLTLATAETVREALVESNPEIKPHLDKLFKIMEDCNYGPKNQLFRPFKEWPERILRELDWFRSTEADWLAKAHSGDDVRLFFSFAKGLVSGHSWAATDGRQATFYTYETRLVIDRTAGVVLLDATADIDGRSKVVPWRVEIETPQASYNNLEIVIIPQHTRTILSKFFKSLPNRRAYTEWMKDAILQHTNDGDKVLLVCRLALFANCNVPWWPTDDERFNNSENYTKNFQWKWEKRKGSYFERLPHNRSEGVLNVAEGVLSEGILSAII